MTKPLDAKDIVPGEPPLPKDKTRVCQQVTGQEYEEYILRSRTRMLGGISPEFRAHVMRCLFPYKPFNDLEKTSEKMPAISSARGLTKKNDSTKERNWTDDERRLFIKTLGAFARWEVDYANFVIRSPRCEGKTIEPGQICKACQAVLNDPSFKRVVRRVSLIMDSYRLAADHYLE